MSESELYQINQSINLLLVQFARLEGAGVVVERLVGHVLIHQIRKAKLRQDPLGPVAGWVGMSLD